MWRTVPFLNVCISIVAFVVALVLIVYMLIAFIAGVFDIGMKLVEAAFMTSDDRQNLFAVLNVDFIYNLAYVLVLMKAYQILAEYMRNYSVDVKSVVEMGIIVAVLELLFNATAYTDHTQFVLMLLATIFFAVYAFRYHVGAMIMNLSGYHEEQEEVEEGYEPEEVEIVAAPSRVRRKPVPAARRVEKVKKVVTPTKSARKVAVK